MAIGEIEFNKYYGRSESSDNPDEDPINIDIKVRVMDDDKVAIIVDTDRDGVAIGIEEVQINIEQIDFIAQSLTIISDMKKAGALTKFRKTI